MAYWLDYGLLALFIPMVVAADWSRVGWGWSAAMLAGLVGFTYAEYWVHRVVLHRLIWHSIHQRHHRHPEEYVTFPVWVMPAFFISLGLLTIPATGNAGLWVGVALGYLWFICWHHVLHHVDLSRWPGPVRRYAAWHDRHHDGGPCNYGITHPFWDKLHGTSQ